MSCFFCHKEGGTKNNDNELTITELENACRAALNQGFTKFKLTGGEPTMRKDICQIISRLSALGLPDLSMITNGTTLYELAQPMWDAGLRRLNVSLDTLNEAKFASMQKRVSNVKVADIMHGIEKAISVGFEGIKINFVYYNDDSENDLLTLLDYVNKYNLTLVLLPVISDNSRYTLTDLYSKLITLGIKTEKIITDNEGIKKNLIKMNSGASVLLRIDELHEFTPYMFCDKCKTKSTCREGIYPIRLSANGELIPCIASNKYRIPIRKYLTDGNISEVEKAFMSIREWSKNE